MAHTAEQRERLETVLDEVASPEELLDMLSLVFSDKASHLLEAWQDSARAKIWDKWSDKLADFSTRMGRQFGNPYA